MILELCKGVHCVDLGESFQTHIYLQNFVSIQPRTSPVKFAASRDKDAANFDKDAANSTALRLGRRGARPGERPQAERICQLKAAPPPASESVGWQNFGKMLLVFGCIGSDFCKKICVLQHFSKSTRFSS